MVGFGMKRQLLMTTTPKRLLSLVQRCGLAKAVSICVSVIEERWLKCFDRRYRVRTSGNIALSTTSFDRSKLNSATAYSPVNAWALRKLFKDLNLPKTMHFVDLGCGLGRA